MEHPNPWRRAVTVPAVTRRTPLVAGWRGVVAGTVGTVAMDLLWFYRYRRGGGDSGFLDWEFATGVSSWEDAGAPAEMGRRLVEGVLHRRLPPERARVTNDVMHWAYGLFWGAQYGAAVASRRHPPTLRSGVIFGALVWASDYVVLPLAGVYKPIWAYDAKTLADDLSAHVVYGATTSATFQLLF